MTDSEKEALLSELDCEICHPQKETRRAPALGVIMVGAGSAIFFGSLAIVAYQWLCKLEGR